MFLILPSKLLRASLEFGIQDPEGLLWAWTSEHTPIHVHFSPWKHKEINPQALQQTKYLTGGKFQIQGCSGGSAALFTNPQLPFFSREIEMFCVLVKEINAVFLWLPAGRSQSQWWECSFSTLGMHPCFFWFFVAELIQEVQCQKWEKSINLGTLSMVKSHHRQRFFTKTLGKKSYCFLNLFSFSSGTSQAEVFYQNLGKNLPGF